MLVERGGVPQHYRPYEHERLRLLPRSFRLRELRTHRRSVGNSLAARTLRHLGTSVSRHQGRNLHRCFGNSRIPGALTQGKRALQVGERAIGLLSSRE